jgi:hypothetical protein
VSSKRTTPTPPRRPKLPLLLRAVGLMICLNLTAAGLLLRHTELQRAIAEPAGEEAAAVVLGEVLPEPLPTASDAVTSPAPSPSPVASPVPPAEPPPVIAAPAPPPPPPPDVLASYRGLGAWVDHYDYGANENLSPPAIVAELAKRGVKTLFLQTGRWASPVAIDDPAAMSLYLELAHQHGIKVVGWYLPGFANIDQDVKRSLAVVNFRSPNGATFDGFAPDIEDAVAVGNDRGRFNAGVAEYSRRLRADVPPGTVLGAVVVDARNNERARGAWAGFPWPAIGQNFDVVLPMAYWSVTKPLHTCRKVQMDSAAYIRDVVARTNALMGVARPMHPIGGIADCNTAEEITGFMIGLKDSGSIGGSLYDFVTNHESPFREAMWAALGSVNGLIPPPPPPPAPPPPPPPPPALPLLVD